MPIFLSSIDEIRRSRALTDKCIILDLDETCVHTFSEPVSTIQELRIHTDPNLMSLRPRIYLLDVDDVVNTDKKGQGRPYDLWGITRPHLKEFLIFCFSYFRIVAVWSAGQAKYVDAICKVIFKDIRPPHVIFSYEDCEKDRAGAIEKPIAKMIASDPMLSKYMRESNTFAIDDRDTTFEHVNPNNGIMIPPYQPSPLINSMMADDLSLLQLKYWLNRPEVKGATDVRSLDKSMIFSTPINRYTDY